MPWHKVTLPSKQCGVDGLGSQLRDAFGMLLIENGGRPFDAAVFSQTSDDHESVYFYFSPAAYQLASTLVKHFDGTPCPGPPFLGNLVSLEVGDARAWELLGVNKPAGLF